MIQTLSTENKAQSLGDWLRDFAIEIREPLAQVDKDLLLKAALSASLELPTTEPNLVELSDILGMSVVCQYGEERIAWIGAKDEEEAEVLLQKYEVQPYSKIRQFFNIQCLWIIIIDLENGFYKSRDVFEAHVEYSQLIDKPDCIIVNL